MARGRMISRTLGTSSKKFARLRTDHPVVGLFAQALFPLLVANCDDFGRMDGDAFAVKHSVWPTAPESEDIFDAALNVMHAVGLVLRYRVESGQCLQVVAWEQHQLGLNKRTASRYPAPSGNVREFPGMSGAREEKRTEENGTNNPPTPLAGGRITRADRRLAEEVLGRRFGKCHHEPECTGRSACLAAIAQEIAAKRTA